MSLQLALILGSGGARGLAFIGALRALEEAGLRVGHVVGSSMGALVGAAYCSGRRPDELAEFAQRFSVRRLLRPDPFGPGLFSPAPLADLASELVTARQFGQLRTPLTVTCTDLQRGVSVRFTEGALIPPVVGSCLAAGAFSPLLHNGLHLVDGGYTDPVPVAGAPPDSVVVAVDPSAVPDWPVDVDPPRAWRHLAKGGRVARQIRKSADTLIYALGRERLRHHDHVLVVPNLGAMTFLDFQLHELAIERGYEAMRAALPTITRTLVGAAAHQGPAT